MFIDETKVELFSLLWWAHQNNHFVHSLKLKMSIVVCLILTTTLFLNCGYAAITTSSPLSVWKTLSSPMDHVILWCHPHLSCMLTPHNEKRVLTSWKSETDPSPEDFVSEITLQSPLSRPSMKRLVTVYSTSGPFGLCVRSHTPTYQWSLLCWRKQIF